MSVSWLLKVVDGATGPLKTITAAARATAAAFRTLKAEGPAKVVKDVENLAKAEQKVNAQLQKQVELHKKLAAPPPRPPAPIVPGSGGGLDLFGGLQAAGRSGGSLLGLTRGVEEMIGAESGSLGLLASAAGKVLEVEIQIAEKAIQIGAELTLAGSKLAIAATTAREMAVDSLTNLVGARSAAEGMYDNAIKLAEKLGTTPEAVLGRMKKLISAGLKPSDVAPAIEAIENATVGISQRAGAALDRSLTKIVAKGFMDNRALTQLAGAGVNVQKIYEALAKKMNKSVSEVEMLTRKGKVNATDAIAAIEEVVNSQSGGLARKRGSSIPGLIMGIGTELKNIFSQIDVKPVQGFFDNILKALHGGGGKELKGALQDFFGSLFHALFDPFKGAEGQKRLERLLYDMANALHNATAAIKAAKPYLSWLFEHLLAASDNGKGTALADDIHDISTALLDLVGGYLGLGPIGEFLDTLQDFELDTSVFTDATDAISGMFDAFVDAGENLMDGLVQGIKDGAGDVVDAVVGAVSNAIDAAKRALGIHSPSTVFAGIGDYTAQGFAEGVEGSDAPSRAVDRMVAPPPMSGLGGFGRGAGGGGGKNFHFDIGAVQLHSSTTDPEQAAKSFARQLREELEAMALEAGA